MRVAVFRLVFLGAILVGMTSALAQAPASIPPFTLKKFESDETVSLDQFSDGIVVLDFFAYWCVPCRKVSTELEEHVQQYYAGKKGNPAGKPVQVLSLNIEQGRAARTRQYIRQTGASLVLDDVDGRVYKALGGRGIPYVIVLAKESGQWNVLYAHAGYEGVDKIRQVIDSVGAAAGRSPTDEPVVSLPATHAVEIGSDGLWSNDILLTDTTATHIYMLGKTEFRTSYSFSTLEVDYNPAEEAFVFWREPANVTEERHTLQESIQHSLTPALTMNGSFGGYDGFQDYRSLWLNEFYRQEYPAGYKEAKPRGANIGAGLRWEYAPTTAFAQVDYAWQTDTIAPGYEKKPFLPLARGRSELDTHTVSVTLENILTPTLRSQAIGLVTDTTGRELRYGGQASLNWALAENWVLRSTVGYSEEAPRFEAWFVEETLETDIDGRWFFSLTGRWYEDTGEIDDSLLLSSAAPELETWHVGLGIRWQGEHSALKLSGGPYFTRYGALGPFTEPFQNLYRERDWGIVQLAFSHQF